MTAVPDVLVEETRVAMRDGVELATDVVVTHDRVPKPALLVRGPYSRATSRQGSDPIALARSGWAVVVQDVRGRFGSGGTFDPFRQEGRDGADTAAWVAAQPWCDGRVVGFGGSYLGFSSWYTAGEDPGALDVIVPSAAGGSQRRAMVYEGGALQLGLVVSWVTDVLIIDPHGPAAQRQRAIELSSDWDALFRQPLGWHPLRELFPPFASWLEPEDDSYWSSVDVTPRLPRLDLPAFQVAGWYDIFCEDALMLHAQMRERAASEYARASQRLIVGPWTHTTMLLPITTEFDFGPMAAGATQGLPQVMLEWARRVLDREPVEDGVTVFVMGSGVWRDLPVWPPRSTPLRLYLSSGRGANGLRGDGVLLRAPAEGVATDRFRYDPQDPVPTRGGRTLGPMRPMAGPVDQRPVEERDDVLVFTSAVLESDLTVMGQVGAEVVFETEGRSADVTVKLVDVWPDGRAYNVVDSVQRADFTPGRSRSVQVAVGSTAMCFRAGHRIRVEVSSSNFPRFDRNPSTGVAAGQAEVLEPAWQTVHHGARAASHLTLPVV